MLELKNVQIDNGMRFDHVFRAGEICVVLGGNRSGKTDLCRFLAGLPSKVSGELVLDGQQLISESRRSAALVFQAFVNYPNMTVRENIAAPLKHRRLTDDEITEKTEHLAALLGIAEFLERLPQALSGGQQQRVAIARALAKEARLLIMDEPLVNLDFKLRERLGRELMGVLKQTGAIVVYASTDPHDAYHLADHLLVLDDGTKLQSGPPMEVYRKPRSPRAMSLTSDPQANFWASGQSLKAIRPEHLGLVTTDQSEAVRFEVLGIEQTGARTLLYGKPTELVSEQDFWTVWLDDPDPGCVPGESVTLFAKVSDIQSFVAS